MNITRDGRAVSLPCPRTEVSKKISCLSYRWPEVSRYRAVALIWGKEKLSRFQEMEVITVKWLSSIGQK